MLCESVLDAVGGTPIVRLGRLCRSLESMIYLKLEFLNPTGSHKARSAVNMIREAERRGDLTPGSVILEATGGNTGKGIAMAAAVLGHRAVLVVPDNYSPRKMRQLERMGAEVVRADSRRGLNCHGERAMEIQIEHPEYYQLFQARNPDNPAIHRHATGPEILADLAGVPLHYFVAGYGTGGHLSGVGEVLRKAHADLRIVAVEPTGCDFRQSRFVPHGLQGLAVGRVPENMDTSLVDQAMQVAYTDCIDMIDLLLKSEGIGVGLSTGAVLAAAYAIGASALTPVNIVCLAYDSIDDYLDELD